VDEVLEEISRDAAFYSNSGGGVTLSGGEPLMQPEFAAYIANEAHAMGYHTAIETTGYADWDHARKVLDKVDLVLYDFKHADSATHMAYTAARNELIVENLGKSVSEGYDITARVPFIRGFNASAENVAAMVDTLSGCGVKTLNILPYHTYGENKYAMLRREYTFRGEKPPEEEISAFIDICRGGGIAARID
jgi:pyruvate formate lyase activating enzyme